MIGIGVIGYGYWGPNLVRNFSSISGARVAAVCDFRDERLALVRTQYPAIFTTRDARELIARADVEAVIISTPVSTHFELALQALQAGKHVLLEKPLTSTVEQAEQLIEVADQHRLVLMVDHTFLYTGAVRKMKELVANGDLGQLYYYDSTRVNLGLFQHDIDVMWDLAVHDLSIMDYILVTAPEAVSATGMAHFPGAPEDVAYLTVFFPGTLIAHFHINWLAPVKLRRTLVGGSLKMIVYDDLEPSEKVKVYDKGISIHTNGDALHKLMVGYRSGDMWAPNLDGTEALRNVALHFVECIETGKRPQTDGAAGLRVVRILAAASASMQGRGRPIELRIG